MKYAMDYNIYLYCLEEFFVILFELPLGVQLPKIFAFAHKPEFPARNCIKGIPAVFFLFRVLYYELYLC